MYIYRSPSGLPHVIAEDRLEISLSTNLTCGICISLGPHKGEFIPTLVPNGLFVLPLIAWNPWDHIKKSSPRPSYRPIHDSIPRCVVAMIDTRYSQHYGYSSLNCALTAAVMLPRASLLQPREFRFSLKPTHIYHRWLYQINHDRFPPLNTSEQ